jgi:hypothetical protein
MAAPIRQEAHRTYAAFAGMRRIAQGPLRAVIDAARSLPRDPLRPIRIFDETGDGVQIDLSGTPEEVVARLATELPGERHDEAVTAGARRPGRPKLGVVSKEVTLLPRHWAWLAAQRGSVSATLRRLIDEARHLHEGRDAVRRAQDSAYRFISVMAGDAPGYEEAIRALYRVDAVRFDAASAAWPPDVRSHARDLAAGAFDTSPAGATER